MISCSIWDNDNRFGSLCPLIRKGLSTIRMQRDNSAVNDVLVYLLTSGPSLCKYLNKLDCIYKTTLH